MEGIGEAGIIAVPNVGGCEQATKQTNKDALSNPIATKTATVEGGHGG